MRAHGWKLVWRAGLVLGLLPVGLVAAGPVRALAANGVEVPSIVELVDGASAEVVAATARVEATATFENAIDGFAADLTATEAQRLRASPLVRRIVPDQSGLVLPGDPGSSVAASDPEDSLPEANPALLGVDTLIAGVRQTLQGVLHGLGLAAPAQVVPTAVARVGVASSPTASVDHIDARVDATIAFVDTGVQAVPDLNLVGGTDCTQSGGGWDDDGYLGTGHGTLVAGVAAAIDNTIGTVGVAPGARVLSAKAVDEQGHGSSASILCALDWATDPAQDVDVINISLGWETGLFGASSLPCGPDADVIHNAICAAVDAGITVVVAAGNGDGQGVPYDINAPSPGAFPAAYPEVITVSGIVDVDGRPGGLGQPASCGSFQHDDDLWARSNYGEAVDIAAVAACVLTLAPDGTTVTNRGTSLAAPAVAGAVALLRSSSGAGWTPAQIRGRLVADAESEGIAGDPDGFPEGVLDVSGY